MAQLANPDTPLEALALQDKAWTHLLHLETQALLECLPPNSTPPVAAKPAPTTSAPISTALMTLQPQIPHPTLPDAYNGVCSSREQFLQSCLTYIHLSKDAFDSNALKIT
ncbi:hypothetical protein C0989_003316 [Termitomyces sp. Mn162]|nr:hypothetical protein C0989_003316 [Termitomyces sp. Mn162]